MLLTLFTTYRSVSYKARALHSSALNTERYIKHCWRTDVNINYVTDNFFISLSCKTNRSYHVSSVIEHR